MPNHEDISLYARCQIFKNKFNIEELQKNTDSINIYSEIIKYLWKKGSILNLVS